MEEEILNQLPGMTIEELWNTINLIKMEDPKFIEQEKYEKIKSGFKLSFDIRRYIIYLNGNKADIRIDYAGGIVRTHAKVYDVVEFNDEWDERTAIMRQIIQNYYSQDIDKVQPRT